MATIKFTGPNDFDIKLVNGHRIVARQVEAITVRLWTAVQEARRDFNKMTMEKKNG